MTTYTRMEIVEALSHAQAREIRNLFDAHAAGLSEPDCLSVFRLSEEGSDTIVMESNWTTRAAMIRYHTSRAYRMFQAAIIPFSCGDPVIKLFSRWQPVLTEVSK